MNEPKVQAVGAAAVPAAPTDVKWARGGKSAVLNTYVKLHESKLGAHWLWCVIERIASGASQAEAFAEYGYELSASPSPASTSAPLTDEELADCGLLSELSEGAPDAAPAGEPPKAVIAALAAIPATGVVNGEWRLGIGGALDAYRILATPTGVAADESTSPEPQGMRAAFMAWVEDQGCDTDGAWSAWQGCWDLLSAQAADESTSAAPDEPCFACNGTGRNLGIDHAPSRERPNAPEGEKQR